MDGRGKLLLVEDEHNLRHLVALFLRASGFDVVEAADGREGIERFDDSGPFDLALVDLNLPIFCGIEVCRHIRASRPDQPILICSAAIMPENEQALRALGVDRFLTKPYHPEALLAHARSMRGNSPRGRTRTSLDPRAPAPAPGLNNYFSRISATTDVARTDLPSPTRAPTAAHTGIKAMLAAWNQAGCGIITMLAIPASRSAVAAIAAWIRGSLMARRAATQEAPNVPRVHPSSNIKNAAVGSRAIAADCTVGSAESRPGGSGIAKNEIVSTPKTRQNPAQRPRKIATTLRRMAFIDSSSIL